MVGKAVVLSSIMLLTWVVAASAGVTITYPGRGQTVGAGTEVKGTVSQRAFVVIYTDVYQAKDNQFIRQVPGIRHWTEEDGSFAVRIATPRVPAEPGTELIYIIHVRAYSQPSRGTDSPDLGEAEVITVPGGVSYLRQTDIFVSGQDGYHTYRIPALVVSNQGTLLAFCEGRKHSRSDAGDIDLVLKRSLDHGTTWEAMQIIWDDGENTIGNPCPVVDRHTGTIWLPFCRNNDRVFVTKSTDDGASWSAPVEITEDVKPPAWGWYATGPGHGIQLNTGRLLIPCDHRQQEGMYSHVFYSDDHGASWQLGGVLDEGTNECEAVETSDGSVYLNMRIYPGTDRRAYAWSQDGGERWSEVQLLDESLHDNCQASVVRFTDTGRHDKNRVLFSNPASSARERLTVRLSYDECQTWTAGKVLHEGPAAYSDLCIAPDMSIGCLYERGEEHPYERITFARFSLEWLTDGADHL